MVLWSGSDGETLRGREFWTASLVTWLNRCCKLGVGIIEIQRRPTHHMPEGTSISIAGKEL